MKPAIFLVALLSLLSIGACHHAIQPAIPPLSGKWEGIWENVPNIYFYCFGRTEKWSNGVTTIWEVRDSTVSGSVAMEKNLFIDSLFPYTPATYYFEGTINNNVVRVREINAENCSGTNRTAQYTGTFSGYNLTLMGSDTLCSAQGCILQRTLRLTR